MNRSFPIATTLLVIGLAACDKPGEEAQRKTDNAEAVASTEITNAEMAADKKATEAQAEEDKKIAAAQSDFEKARDDYRQTMQPKLDELDKKLADLHTKAVRAVGTQRADLLAMTVSLREERDAFAADLAALETKTGADWDIERARVDKEWSKLKADIEQAK
jgi:hypothetical protein